MSTAPLAVLALGLGLGLASLEAQAQVYGGKSATGAVFLSDQQSADAAELIVDAPRALAPVAPENKPNALPSPAPQAPYADLIREASELYRVPAELIHAVIKVESNYNPRAVSAKGALGLMQLMPGTSRRFGAVNSLDPRENILTGSRYLRWLMDFFKQDLALTLAAYNAGEMAVVHAGYQIPRITETQSYVPKVMGLYQRAVTPG